MMDKRLVKYIDEDAVNTELTEEKDTESTEE